MWGSIWAFRFFKGKIWYTQSFICIIKMFSIINDFHITYNNDCCICTLLTYTSNGDMLLKTYIGLFRVEGISVFLNNYIFCLYCIISLEGKFSCLYCMISFKFFKHCVVDTAVFASAERCDRASENWLPVDGTRNWFSGQRQATQELSFQESLKNAQKMFLLKKK